MYEKRFSSNCLPFHSKNGILVYVSVSSFISHRPIFEAGLQVQYAFILHWLVALIYKINFIPTDFQEGLCIFISIVQLNIVFLVYSRVFIYMFIFIFGCLSICEDFSSCIFELFDLSGCVSVHDLEILFSLPYRATIPSTPSGEQVSSESLPRQLLGGTFSFC